MSDEVKHECAVAMVVLRKPSAVDAGDFGGTKLSLLLEKQHNRGQDGAGAAILSNHPSPGSPPYQLFKSASGTPLVDILGMLTKRSRVETGLTGLPGGTPPDPKNPVNPDKTRFERIFLGHLRYATFGKNDVAYCHPFVHESSDLAHTLLLAGNFNLTNTAELFEDYSTHGSFPTSKADGYLVTELISKELRSRPDVDAALSKALANADGAWMLCGMTGDGWAFATRDPHGIRPGFFYVDERVAVVASERPAIQAAFDVPPEAVREVPPGAALLVSPEGEVEFCDLDVGLETRDEGRNAPSCPAFRPPRPAPRPCAFERIYFSRANDSDIHRERKALGAALVPQILKAAGAPIEDIFFSYIPNSARIAFHGLLEELFSRVVGDNIVGVQSWSSRKEDSTLQLKTPTPTNNSTLQLQLKTPTPTNPLPRFGEVIVKDAKFRTFIADAAARREFYKHVYDVTYGLVRPGLDTLVVLDDSIVRGNTMKNAILPMLDRLGPKRIVIASSAPPIRYPDCYGIDMSTLGELVAFRALVNLLGKDAERLLREIVGVQSWSSRKEDSTLQLKTPTPTNPLAALYARFTDEEHCAEIARLLTPPGIKAEVVVVYQTVENLRQCLSRPSGHSIGDWYFTGEYPTPGGYRVLRTAVNHYLEKSNERSY